MNWELTFTAREAGFNIVITHSATRDPSWPIWSWAVYRDGSTNALGLGSDSSSDNAKRRSTDCLRKFVEAVRLSSPQK